MEKLEIRTSVLVSELNDNHRVHDHFQAICNCMSLHIKSGFLDEQLKEASPKDYSRKGDILTLLADEASREFLTIAPSMDDSRNFESVDLILVLHPENEHLEEIGALIKKISESSSLNSDVSFREFDGDHSFDLKIYSQQMSALPEKYRQGIRYFFDGETVSRIAPLPKELCGKTPRAVPEYVANGPMATRTRNAVWTIAMIGCFCMAISPLPLTHTIALYFLPLKFVLWIGLFLVCFAAFIHFTKINFHRARRFLIDGNVTLGQVISLIKSPTVVMNGQPTTYAFHTKVMLTEDGDNNSVIDIKSNDFSADIKDNIDTKFRVGDFVPVLWLPLQKSSSQIYDFLELTESASLARPNKNWSLKYAIAITFIALCVVSAVGLSLYFLSRYRTLDNDGGRNAIYPVIIGVGLGLVGCVVYCYRSFWPKRKNHKNEFDTNAIEIAYEATKTTRWLNHGLLMLGIVMLSVVLTYTTAIACNSLLDTSTPKKIPVELTDAFEVTHSYIFREYELKFKMPEIENEQSFMSSPDHLSSFAGKEALATLRTGYFGWPWIESVEPIFVAPEEWLRALEKQGIKADLEDFTPQEDLQTD